MWCCAYRGFVITRPGVLTSFGGCAHLRLSPYPPPDGCRAVTAAAALQYHFRLFPPVPPPSLYVILNYIARLFGRQRFVGANWLPIARLLAFSCLSGTHVYSSLRRNGDVSASCATSNKQIKLIHRYQPASRTRVSFGNIKFIVYVCSFFFVLFNYSVVSLFLLRFCAAGFLVCCEIILSLFFLPIFNHLIEGHAWPWLSTELKLKGRRLPPTRWPWYWALNGVTKVKERWSICWPQTWTLCAGVRYVRPFLFLI